MKNLHETIQNSTRIYIIYIIDDTESSLPELSITTKKCADIDEVCDQLEKDSLPLISEFPNIVSISSEDRSNSALAYVQVLKDIILETSGQENRKKEMIEFCQEKYSGNPIQLNFIDNFNSHFQTHQAVKWFQCRERFLFKMITRAFRTPDPDILYKLRYFIQHLHAQIESTSPNTQMTVYRTLSVPKTTLERIKEQVGGYLSFNEFFFAYKTSEKSKKLLQKPNEILIHFEMELGTDVSRTEADKTANLVLLTVGTVFRIIKVETIDDETCRIKLLSNQDVAKSVRELIKNVSEAARAPFPSIQMAKLLKHMNYMYHTEYFCLTAMKDPVAINNKAANLTLGGLFHSLGTFYYEREKYDQALQQLEHSLKVYRRVLEEDDIILTPTYNNMGSIYHKQGLDEKALELHQRAYQIQKRSANPDLDSLVAYAGNIASVLVKLNRYEEAIEYFEVDLKIQKRMNPDAETLSLAAKYHNLAGTQFRAQRYKDAVENYENCLKIELRLHAPNHPTVSVTYFNMATAYEGLGQLEKAVECVDKAIQRLLMTKDENDGEVTMQREYRTRLQQKLWVKTLFNTEEDETVH